MIRSAMGGLQISNRREHRIVFTADCALALTAAVAAPFRARRRPAAPARILLLRLERIGDLLMTLPAIAEVRARAPEAEIDLIVGSWNAALANAIVGITRVETMDASWLSRGTPGLGLAAMVRRARGWRARNYGLAINFEPDIRSNLLAGLSGASWIAGYRSGGGGALLDEALDFDARMHTSDNARRLVGEAFGAAAAGGSTRSAADSSRRWLQLPDSAVRTVIQRLSAAGSGPLVAIHTSGGRAIKQWEPSRFAEVAQRLASETSHDVTIVLTGDAADRRLVDVVKRVVPQRRIIDIAGDLDLLQLAALLERVDVLITGDTGPMHLAHAVGTAVVAIFGPSDPVRYAPRGAANRIVRVDLPCSPCNRIRQPPERCVGHTPDCLSSVSVERVMQAVSSVLAGAGRARRLSQ